MQRNFKIVAGIFCALVVASSYPAFSAVDKAQACFEKLSDPAKKMGFEAVKTPCLKKAISALHNINYAEVVQRLEVSSPGTMEGEFACWSGLQAHSGGSDEAIICLSKNNEVQVGLLIEGKVFSYTKTEPWAPIKSWVSVR